MQSRKIWIPSAVVSLVAGVWLLWAFPHLQPAARLGLQFDREGYLAQARRIIAAEHGDVTGWHGYVKAESLTRNQQFHTRRPKDDVAQAVPDAQVLTNFLPPNRGAGGIKVTLRPDGRPLSWKLPVPSGKAPAAKDDSPATGPADDAMHRMAGQDSPHYVMNGEGTAGSDGMTYRWKRVEEGPESASIGLEASVKNGVAWRTNTTFTLPDRTSKTKLNRVSAPAIIAGTAWSLLLFLALVISVMREGGGVTARAMKDRPVLVLSIIPALVATLTTIIEWDDEMIAVPVYTGASLKVLSIVLAAVAVGLLFYSMSAATVLNARLHPARVRGFRLFGTRAFFSRTTGSELLGGWLFAPVIVAVPLAVGALMRVPSFKGFDEDVVLNRLPSLDALLNATGQDTVEFVVLLGVLIPLAIRFARSGRVSLTLIAVFAALTFLMMETPFDSQAANVVCAALNGLLITWIYLRFGMLGALGSHCSARILTSAGMLLVQPAAGLHSSGLGIVATFAGLGLLSLIAATKGPEVVAELYGETGVRVLARSRREELLAEFNVARSAQQQMLPSEPPVLEGYSIAASCEPAREVGGDLYDFLRLSDGRWGIGVADVSGKGVPAALYMTLTKGLLCAAAQDSSDPSRILAAVNKHLRTVTKRKMFVTMALGVLDPAAKRMDYVRAGHNPVVWRRRTAGETRLLAGPGIGLGITGPALFSKTLTTETLDLAPGDAVVFYSDGLTEAMNGVLEQFGEERLMAAVESADGMHAAATRDSILGEVKRFLEGAHPQDDLTIAVLRVNAETRIEGDN